MAEHELSNDQKKKQTVTIKKNKKPKHYLKRYNEGNFNNHEVVIVSLQNDMGIVKYIVPKQSQLSMRTQYYWINGIKDFLEKGLIQDRLVISEEYQVIEFSGEEYFVNKELL